MAPKGDMVFVKCAPEEVKTLGGILLPGSATRRPTSGTVVELGDGRVGKAETHAFSLKKGDSVPHRFSPCDCVLIRCYTANLDLLIQS